MIKKQREKREVVLESKKDQAKRDFLLNLNVRVEVEYETKKAVKRKYIQNYPVQNIVKKGEYKEEIKKKMIDDLTMKLRSYGSGFASVDILSVEESEHDIIDGGENKNIKMKEAHALPIDGHETQDWDTKTGKCVFDYIIHRYGSIKGFIKFCTYEKLNQLFMDYDEIEGTYTYPDALEHGVSTMQIELFCQKFGIPMYALDLDNFYFHTYIPEEKKPKCTITSVQACQSTFLSYLRLSRGSIKSHSY